MWEGVGVQSNECGQTVLVSYYMHESVKECIHKITGYAVLLLLEYWRVAQKFIQKKTLF